MTMAQLYEIYLSHPSIRTDTRQLKKGDLFFALKGPNFNGNTFATRALELGAAYAVIDEVPAGLEDMPPAGLAPDLSDRLIIVEDVLTALQELALHHRRQFDIPFIAITGSNGKTTTKELIHAVLSSTYPTYTTQGNLNNHIGIPLTILSVQKDAQYAVIEMGANHQKEIEGYCRYTLPTHGIITNVGKAHLEGFGGPEGVKKGKGELYDFLRSTLVPATTHNAAATIHNNAATHNAATAFVLRDSADLMQMSRGIPHIVTYGTHDADITGIPSPSKATAADPFLAVEMTHGAAIGPVHTQLVGDYNLPNVLVAVAVGKHFGVSDTAIRLAIENYTPSNSRSQLIERDGLHIILDAYNANPSSMRAAIENFARLPIAANPNPGNPTSADPNPGNPNPADPNPETPSPRNPNPADPTASRKVLILGAMAELGPESLAEHQAIIDLIGQYSWQQVVLVGGDFRHLSHPYLSFANSKEAGRWLAGVGLKDSYLLIKGSRSMKMEEVLA
jgi:UDP-N-acetylmuramoyl-tripeptide--D-alanyl-D-alanine ligase